MNATSLKESILRCLENTEDPSNNPGDFAFKPEARIVAKQEFIGSILGQSIIH